MAINSQGIDIPCFFLRQSERDLILAPQYPEWSTNQNAPFTASLWSIAEEERRATRNQQKVCKKFVDMIHCEKFGLIQKVPRSLAQPRTCVSSLKRPDIERLPCTNTWRSPFPFMLFFSFLRLTCYTTINITVLFNFTHIVQHGLHL